MQRDMVRIAEATVILVLIAGYVEAQQPAAVQFAVERYGLSQGKEDSEPAVLERRINLDIRGVSLDAALSELGRRSGVDIMYSKAVLPRDRRVTIKETNRPIGDILDRILQGTGASARATAKGQIVVSVGGQRSAREQGVISGRVLHAKTKQPLAGATVTVGDKSTVTDPDGKYRIPVIPGDHLIQVKSVGMIRQSKQVVVKSDAVHTVDFVLEPSASVLDEVVVTGTVVATERKAIPAPITVITAEDIEKRGLTRVEQLFRGEVPGVLALERGTMSYSKEPQGNLSLGEMDKTVVYSRGSASLSGSPNPLKTYVDGVEILDPAMLGGIDLASVERIEILAGPQAATIYGAGALGGVMQIFTKKGSEGMLEVALNLKYGVLQNSLADNLAPSHNHSVSVRGGGGPQFSYSGTLSYRSVGQWQPGLIDHRYGASVGLTHTQNALTVDGSLGLAGGVNGTYGYCGVSPGTLDYQTKTSTGEYSVKYYTCFEKELSRSLNENLALSVNFRPLPSWQHRITLGRNRVDLELDPVSPKFGVAYDSTFKAGSSTGKRTTLSYNTTVMRNVGFAAISLTVGGDGSWDGGTIQNQGCLAAKSSTTYVACGSGALPSISRRANIASWGGFSNLQVGLMERAFFTYAVRGTHDPRYGRKHSVDWTPTIGATYLFEYSGLTTRLIGSYGRATRSPDDNQRRQRIINQSDYQPSMFVDQFENLELTPEYSRGPQVGMEVYWESRASLNITRYTQEVVSLIMPVTIDSLFVDIPRNNYSLWWKQIQNRNAAIIEQQGWAGEGSLTLGPIAVKGTYSWDDSRIVKRENILGEVTRYAPGLVFRGVPAHKGYLMLSYARGNTAIHVSSNFIGASFTSSSYTDYSHQLLFSRLKMYTDLGSVSRLPSMVTTPGYSKTDIAGTHRVAPWASLTLNIVNAGNSFQSDVYKMVPSLGRQTLIGLALRYPR